MFDDYQWAGLRYDKPSVRIERLDEALTIITSMWSKKKTTFAGKHYAVNEAPLKIEMPERPKILIGGGGRKLLSVAGRYADIVGINPTIPEGRITAATALDITPESVRQKIEWVHAAAVAAGRDTAALELNALVFVAAITDQPAAMRDMAAASTGMPADRIADCPLFLIGSGAEVRDTLEARRDATGISYVVIQGRDPAQVEQFAREVVEPMTGA
jgi:alkanesulfonate monooxygenase SsuD/methylene tetrahydromethanopterin reductase-like flavin-dependent oxidoreductase (luciferase family)